MGWNIEQAVVLWGSCVGMVVGLWDVDRVLWDSHVGGALEGAKDGDRDVVDVAGVAGVVGVVGVLDVEDMEVAFHMLALDRLGRAPLQVF